MKIICDRCRAECSGDFTMRTDRAAKVDPADPLRILLVELDVGLQLCPDCAAGKPLCEDK